MTLIERVDVASNSHIGSVQAIHRGLQKRQTPSYWVQISGASGLAVEELASPSFKPGEPSDDVWDDLAGVASIRDLLKAHKSRAVDNYILDVAKQTPSVKTALVLPPIIYGKGQGPIKQRSYQIPALAKVALERGRAVRVGRGLSRWGNVHVADVARLFTVLAEAGAKGNDDSKIWGEDGIYLTGVGEIVSTAFPARCTTNANPHISRGPTSQTESPKRQRTRAFWRPLKWRSFTSPRPTLCCPTALSCSAATLEVTPVAALSCWDGSPQKRASRPRSRER